MLCLSGFELYSRWVPLLYPLHADKSFAQVSLSRCMRKVASDLECLLRRKPLLSLNVRCIYRLA